MLDPQTQKDIMSLLNVRSTDDSCNKQALETELTQLKDTVTCLKIQNDGYKVTNANLNRCYEELSKANTHLRTTSLEKIVAQKAEIATLNAKTVGNKTSRTTKLANPKVIASGMYAISPKYIIPQRRTNRETPILLPKKKQVTFQETSKPSPRFIKKPVTPLLKKPNINVPLSTRIKSATEASKPSSKSNAWIYRKLPAKSAKGENVEEHIRNLNQNNRAYDFDCSLHLIAITIIRRFLDPVSFSMGATSHNFFKSKEEYTQAISNSIFVTTFPDHFSVRDLWNMCLTYGTVVDIFVPFKRSKAGKKFAFVRFIKVDNLERLIGNICTIWIGCLRLHANIVRFQWEPKSNGTSNTNANTVHSILPKTNVSGGAFRKTFSTVLSHGPSVDEPSALVLDDSCLSKRDLSCSLMGKAKDINTLSNLYFALSNEGFTNVKLSYLGGHWVLMKLDTIATKEKVLLHVRVGSWFEVLKQAYHSFVCKERLVWVTIEGLPVKALTRNTFAKITSTWGELIDIDDAKNSPLSCIRVCVKTKPHVLIDDRIKIIIKGQIYWIRVKEWEAWIPDFGTDNEDDSSSDDEFKGDNENDDRSINDDLEHDPFGIYEILNKNKKSSGDDPKYPPGYTLVGLNTDVDNFVITKQEKLDHTSPQASLHGDGTNRVNNESHSKASSVNGNHFLGTKIQASGSILDVMDDLIKELWGNLAFDYAFSPSVGSFGDILCAWDPSVFVKDNSMVSDSFVAVYGTWIPSTTKLLDGKSILLGDFNEVRFEHERYAFVFNPNGANVFNNFIASSSLVDLPMDGFSFTWSHKSASKMSKLDRFLISDGLLAYFPSLSFTCLDKYLSDHRPILLRETNVDYGPYPFRFFNSWLVGNLCKLWIGRMHLHANVVRFERTHSQVPRPSQPVRKTTHTGNTCASVMKGNLVYPMSSSPALVLDDTCLEDRDYENCVMGKILQFSSISNLRILLFHEGFLSVRTVYLGGLWVMIELNSPETKNKLMNHVGVDSWFKSLHNVQAEFVAKERIEISEVEHSSDDVSTKGEADNDNGTAGSNMTPPFPPGFTPEVRQQGHYDNGNPNVDNVVDTN
nr:RNA-directed DNA polymerase, eukaryota, nucleotide-binding alpha-beta plait domain protein [Tanacetum cinerariifolium]